MLLCVDGMEHLRLLLHLTSTEIADESIPNKEPKDVEDRDFRMENNTSVSLCCVPEAVVLLHIISLSLGLIQVLDLV